MGRHQQRRGELREGPNRGGEHYYRHWLGGGEVVPTPVCLPHVLGQRDNPGSDIIDRSEVDRRARACRHVPNAPLGDHLERGIDRVERANRPTRAFAHHHALGRAIA